MKTRCWRLTKPAASKNYASKRIVPCSQTTWCEGWRGRRWPSSALSAGAIRTSSGSTHTASFTSCNRVPTSPGIERCGDAAKGRGREGEGESGRQRAADEHAFFHPLSPSPALFVAVSPSWICVDFAGGVNYLE